MTTQTALQPTLIRLDAALELVRRDRWMLGGLRGHRLQVLGLGPGRTPRPEARNRVPQLVDVSPIAHRCLAEDQPVAVTTILGAGITAEDWEWEQMWPTVLYAPVPAREGAPIGLLVLGCRSMHWYEEADVDFVAALAASLTDVVAKAMDPLGGLAHEERMTAYLMAEGLSGAEVARALKTDRERAQLLMGGVLKKLNLRSRGDLAVLLGVGGDSSSAMG